MHKMNTIPDDSRACTMSSAMKEMISGTLLRTAERQVFMPDKFHHLRGNEQQPLMPCMFFFANREETAGWVFVAYPKSSWGRIGGGSVRAFKFGHAYFRDREKRKADAIRKHKRD